MAEITYYAIVDDYTTGDEPIGVLRRFEDGDRRDESFGRDLECTRIVLVGRLRTNIASVRGRRSIVR